MENSDQFYADLTPFTEFSEVVQDSMFTTVPDDWCLIISDIPGSTAAIGAGRYKDVNVIGAATIVGALNASKNYEIPFVFGGDGATFAVPPTIEGKVLKALRMARWTAQTRFKMDLRIGSFNVGELRKTSGEVRVAKYVLSSQIELAMFRGQGMRAAEAQLKDPALAAKFAATFAPIEASNDVFDGLECRWNPLKPEKGFAASLIIIARDEGPIGQEIYLEFLKKIDEIIGRDRLSPVSKVSIPLSWPPKDLMGEVRIRSAGLNFFGRTYYLLRALVTSFFGYLILKGNRDVGNFSTRKYLQDLIHNSDYRKFDNGLRMVLDCSLEQAARLKGYLEGRHAAGEIFYGVQMSKSALMTCLVFSWDNHVHFIDGSDGGYASAAKQLKEQMKMREKPV